MRTEAMEICIFSTAEVEVVEVEVNPEVMGVVVTVMLMTRPVVERVVRFPVVEGTDPVVEGTPVV